MAEPFTIYKLIVLYMLENCETSLTNSQITDFILEREYTNYFHLQQAVSELVEADLIQKQTVSNTSHYQLTSDGKNTLSYFEKDLSPDIKEEIQEYLKTEGFEISEQRLTPAEYYRTAQGSYVVRCQIIEKGIAVVDLNMTAPGLPAAKSICRNWPARCRKIYEKIMEELL